MNEVLLNNQVIVYLLSEVVLLALLFVAFLMSVGMLKSWDFGSFSERQFALERRAYLVMTIIVFVFAVKFFLLIYFVFTIDSLSVLVPGAMCAAGVISANDYGMYLLLLKLLILFFLLLWMALNRYDLLAKDYPVFRTKTWLFVFIFLLVLLEISLGIAYFWHIDLLQPVSCCSTLYGQLEGANPLPFGLDMRNLLILFYLLYVVLIAALASSQKFLAIISGAFFVYIAYYAVVYFFGTYVYELPTHNCPFCMMQKEYYYVGYLIWGSLFGGVFFALISSIMELYVRQERGAEKKAALILLSIFVILCTGYVAAYYLRTGAFL
jgi:hypothetical protein